MLKYSVLSAVCVFWIHAACAQICSISITGRVVDVHYETPLSFASVYLEGGLYAACDENGKFSITGICSGTYIAHASYTGFIEKVDTIKLTENLFYEFRLEHDTLDLDYVYVDAHRDHERTTQSQISIEGKALDRLSGKSLGAALKEVNGVTALQTGSTIAKPVIHGLHSNRILIMNNGVRQEGQQWGNEHGPEIDPFVAGRFTVIKGAAAVQYGSDAIGGVILVDPAALPDTAGTSGEIHMVGFSNTRGGAFAGMIEHRSAKLPPLAFRLQGSAQREGNIHAADYYLANTASGTYGTSATAEYHKDDWRFEGYYSLYHADVGIFSGSHIGNLTDLETAFASDTPLVHQDFTYTINRPYQQITHHLLKGVIDHHNEQIGTMLLTVAWQNDLRSEYDAHAPLNDSIAALQLPSLYFEIGTLTVDGSWLRHPTKLHSGKIGFNFMNQQNITRYATFIPNFKNYSGGIYAIEQYHTGGWLLEAGVRYDYKWIKIFRYVDDVLDMPERNFSNLSANAGIQYFDNKYTEYHLNFGTAWRAPAVSELYSDGLHHGAASLEYGNDSLQSERSYQATFTIEHDSKKWFVDFGVYNNYILDFIYLQPTLPAELTIRGAFPVFHYQQANANLFGVDGTVRYAFRNDLTAELKGSMLRAKNLETNSWIVMMPADRLRGALNYQYPKSIGLWRNLRAGLNTQYVFKQTRVEPDEDYVTPPEGYTLVGASIEGDLNLSNTTIGISLEAENALNAAYRDYLNRFRYFADDMGRNISLRIKIPIK